MNFIYWLLCFVIAFVPALVIFQKDKKRSIPVTWLPASLRFFVFFFTAALLLAPAFYTQKILEEKPVIIWLQDNSLSMNTALGKDSVQFKDKAKTLWKKLEKDHELFQMSFGSEIHRNVAFDFKEPVTNISSALQSISEQFKDRNIAAVILASDGNFNEGLNPLYGNFAAIPAIYTIGLGDSTKPLDAAVTRVYANKTIALNSTFEIIADISALKLNGLKTELALIHKGRTIDKKPIEINRESFNTTVRFEVKANEKGYQNYSVQLPLIGTEKNGQNNKMDVVVEVVENQINVLLWAASPHPDIFAIKEALSANDQYKLTIKYGNDAALEFSNYNLIIAHQIPSISGISLPAIKEIPVWFILGSQSNLPAFSSGQNALKISGSGSPNVVLPRLNKSFSLFTLPANIQAVLDKMPPLDVPSGNFQASGNTQVLFQQQIGNISTQYPLWLLQSGNPSTAILAGTGIWRWRIFEYKNFKTHETVDELIRQTVNFLSVKKDRRPFQVFLDKYSFTENEPVHVFGELRNENGELINTPDASVQVKDSLGKILKYQFEKQGNRYHLNLGYLASGEYTFIGKVTRNGQNFESAGSFRIRSQPLEYLKMYSDYDLLYQLAHQSKGLFFTLSNMQNLEKVLQSDPQIKPLLHQEKVSLHFIDIKWIFFLILLFAVGEWLLRKYWSLN